MRADGALAGAIINADSMAAPSFDAGHVSGEVAAFGHGIPRYS